MTSRIKLLPDVLINKIAAGEVIERPASIVKELVENSLDADAKRIAVTIREGGLSQIEVSDDGSGMTPEELKLAVQRHATSKLSQPEDLFNINSFGFRGEALPSITSVSRFTIKSRPRGADSGYLLDIEGGRLIQETPTGCDYGTLVTVRNLFYNTPARRKFLKSPAAEVRQIVKVMEWLSLANPATEFVLESDDRRLLDLAKTGDKFDRARQLFGIMQSDKFLTGEKFSDHLKLEIFLSRPELCRRNRSRLMFLVNGRRIESKSLFAALLSSYGEFLVKGMYPQGVVFITIDPSLVDVNVHPAKSEVRFSDERVIFHMLYHLVRETLLSGKVVPSYSSGVQRRHAGLSSGDLRTRTRQSVREFFDTQGGRGGESETSLAALFDTPSTQAIEPDQPAGIHKAPAVLETRIKGEQKEIAESGARVVLSASAKYHQMARLYIIAVTPESVIIVDQHAAHERILYEMALRSFKKSAIVSQQLLLPISIQLEPQDFLVFENEKEALARLGFVVSEFGPRQLQLEAVPAILGNRNPEALLRELLDDFSDLSGDEEKRYKKKAASFACRGAVMAGDRLSESEMRGLLENLLAAENPYICPHGRPTMIKITEHDLDLKFHRLG